MDKAYIRAIKEIKLIVVANCRRAETVGGGDYCDRTHTHTHFELDIAHPSNRADKGVIDVYQITEEKKTCSGSQIRG